MRSGPPNQPDDIPRGGGGSSFSGTLPMSNGQPNQQDDIPRGGGGQDGSGTPPMRNGHTNARQSNGWGKGSSGERNGNPNNNNVRDRTMPIVGALKIVPPTTPGRDQGWGESDILDQMGLM